MTASTFPQQLRRWRQHRRCSQLDLALSASVSQRHLSCLESGKALPSRQMVLLLAEALNLPLRDRNALLQAAGITPERLANLANVGGRLNVMRLTLHPDGLRPLIENLDDVQRHFAQRCRREQEATLSDAGWLAIPSRTCCQRWPETSPRPQTRCCR